MIYVLGFMLLGVGLLAFISVIFINYFVVRNQTSSKYHYLPTYILVSLLFVSFVLIIIDLLTEDISVSSGFRGLRGFLAYSTFVINLIDVIVSFISVKVFRRRKSQR